MFGHITRSKTSIAAACLVILGSAACGGNTLGTLGQVLGSAVPGAQAGQQSGQITATIRAVDTKQSSIQVTTTDGQTGNVRYDQNTVVVYQQQQYPVTALERGDEVTMQVTQSQNELYVSRVDVTRSVQQQTGQTTSNGQILEYSGTVQQIDQQRGTFTLQTRNGNVLVSLPYGAPQATIDYFRKLRNGNSVRLEGTSLSTGRVEIYRFL